MIDEKIIDRVAKNVGCEKAQLVAKYDTVLATNEANFKAMGLEQNDIEMKALRMAAAELRVVAQRLSRSGCENIEGMFISVPRTKDISARQYQNMKNTLRGLDEEARTAMVAQGVCALFLNDDVNGGYRYIHNSSLENKRAFEIVSDEKHMTDLPKAAMDLEDGTGHFVLIADKSAPSWPSGGANFRYGRYKAQSEPMRDCLFLGRTASNKNLRVLKIRFSGEDAEVQHPTFVLGRIPAKVGKNDINAYAKKGVSSFTADPSLVEIFPAPPMDSSGGGLLADLTDIAMLTGMGEIETWLGSLSDKEKWDAQCAVPLEVAHIDPREGGGFIITLADLDITSPIPPLDLWVSREEDAKVDFAVGSIVLAVGGAWIDKNTELPRLGVNGWWVMESVEATSVEEVVLEEGAEEGGW